ncbi:MAG: DNA primase [Syntrophobacteraceae bacterium]
MGASEAANLIKQAVDILDVVGRVVPLRRVGNRHVGLCPFHQEKTPSFHVDASNQFYHCFGCGSGGDVLSFVMRHQNLSFGEAIEFLAERYQVVLPEDHGKGSQNRGRDEAALKEREELFRVMEAASEFYYRQLHHSSEGKIARDYIIRRGLPAEVVEGERLGYAPPRWDGLSTFLEQAGFDLLLGEKSGLLSRSAKNQLFDRFRNRLIFPIRNETNRIVAFGGRTLGKEEPRGNDGTSGSTGRGFEPKYLNSPETVLYHKGKMLYQLARAREACKAVRQVVLVEGYMDLLAFHAHGFLRVVATLGTALTPQQVRLLARMSDEVVLAYDGDDAGEKAMLRALPLLQQEAITATCVRFPEGLDPDDFLKEERLAGFERLLEQRSDLGRFAIERVLEEWDGSAAGKAGVLTRVKPLVQGARQLLLRSEYTRLIAERLSVPENTVMLEIQQGSGGQATPLRHGQARMRVDQHRSQEENILRLLVKYPALIAGAKSSGATDFFQNKNVRAVAEALLAVEYVPDKPFDASAVYDSLTEESQRELFTRFLLEPLELEEPEVQMHDYLTALREGGSKTLRLKALNEALHQAEADKDSVRMLEVLAELRRFHDGKKKAKGLSEGV